VPLFYVRRNHATPATTSSTAAMRGSDKLSWRYSALSAVAGLPGVRYVEPDELQSIAD